MKFGLNKSEYKILEELIFSPFRNEGVKVWVFGSRARGDHQKYSDIDILSLQSDSAYPLTTEGRYIDFGANKPSQPMKK